MYYFICVNYNNSGYTENLVKSVVTQSENACVIVVDNKSNESESNKLKLIEKNIKKILR